MPSAAATAALVVALLSPAPSAREYGDGYSFEHPLDWRMESFEGGFFVRSPAFGGAMIIGDRAPAPQRGSLEEALAASLDHMINVRDPQVLERSAASIGDRTGARVRFRGDGGRVEGLLSGVAMPNGRVFSVFLRSIPAEKIGTYLPVYEGLLRSVRFEVTPLDDRRAIRRAFYDYKHHALSRRGNKALPLVSRGTLEFYERCRRLAIAAGEKETRGLPLAEKFMVLSLRHRIDRAALAGMTAEAIFARGIKEKWIDEERVARGELGEVTISGERARAEYFDGGEPVPYPFEFSREDGAWRLDLVAFLRQEPLQAAPAQPGVAEDQALERALERATRKKVSPTIWR